MKKISEYTDIELIDSFSAKPKIAESAFAEFYSRYSDMLWNYIRKFTGLNEDVQDLFQEIMINFFEGGKKKKGKITNAKSFFFMVAKNRCINFLRDHRDFSDFAEGVYKNKSSDYADKHLTELILAEIQQMNYDDRDYLILKFYQDWSIREIADYHEKDEQFIRNKIWRARKKLIKKLKPYLNELKKINKIVLE
jgi:RNA polymerase sigma-70 factor (ECF subfamily)